MRSQRPVDHRLCPAAFHRKSLRLLLTAELAMNTSRRAQTIVWVFKIFPRVFVCGPAPSADIHDGKDRFTTLSCFRVPAPRFHPHDLADDSGTRPVPIILRHIVRVRDNPIMPAFETFQ